MNQELREYLIAKQAWNGPLGFDTSVPVHALIDQDGYTVVSSVSKVAMVDLQVRAVRENPGATALTVRSTRVPIATVLMACEPEVALARAA